MKQSIQAKLMKKGVPVIMAICMLTMGFSGLAFASGYGAVGADSISSISTADLGSYAASKATDNTHLQRGGAAVGAYTGMRLGVAGGTAVAGPAGGLIGGAIGAFAGAA